MQQTVLRKIQTDKRSVGMHFQTTHKNNGFQYFPSYTNYSQDKKITQLFIRLPSNVCKTPSLTYTAYLAVHDGQPGNCLDGKPKRYTECSQANSSYTTRNHGFRKRTAGSNMSAMEASRLWVQAQMTTHNKLFSL